MQVVEFRGVEVLGWKWCLDGPSISFLGDYGSEEGNKD